MVITSMLVEGFRSLTIVLVRRFARTTILAGRNSTGKSNILRALSLVTDASASAESLCDDDFSPGSSQIRIVLKMQISINDRNALIGPIRRAKSGLSKPLQDFAHIFYPNLAYSVVFRRADPTNPIYYLGYTKTTRQYPLFAKGASTGVNNQVLQELWAILEQHYGLVNARDSFGSIASSQQNDICALLLRQFLSVGPAERPRYNEVRDALSYISEGICGEIQPAQLASDDESTESSSNVQLRSEIERSFYVPVQYMGDGAQRVALILYHIVNSPYELLGIEEPEAGLHSGAQKRFRKTLDQLCSKYRKRLLLTTHSSVFLDGWEASSLLRVDIVRGKSVLSEATDREQVVDIARILGISPGDALAADGIIWVEGPSDVAVYSAFLETLGTDLEASNILLMWAGGDAMQHLSASDLSRLNPNFAVMVDSDCRSPRHNAPAWKRRLARECTASGSFAFITQRREIENYFPLRAVRRYYRKWNIPPFGEHVQLATHITAHVSGASYNKMRDSGPIARDVNANEIENLGDLTQALREIQSLISLWKGSG